MKFHAEEIVTDMGAFELCEHVTFEDISDIEAEELDNDE